MWDRLHFRRPSPADVLFAVVVATLTVMAARVWWISAIVPGMDYPQFLVFVRAVQDMGDPSSPFHGTYTVGPWFMPTSLPVHLTSALSYVAGHSIENAGKVLLTSAYVGVVGAGLYLLKVLERPRWAILLVFPLIHSVWTVVGGFAAFATSVPIQVLGWALTVRWLQRLDLRSGLGLTACICCIFLWHGLGFTQLGFGFGVLWLLWRAPSWRARALAVLPTLPSLVLCAAWMSTTYGDKSARPPPSWVPPWEAAEAIFDLVGPSVPHYTVRAFALLVLLGVGLLLGERNQGAAPHAGGMWRIRNVGLVISLAYFGAYFVSPRDMFGVSGVGVRFAYPAALAIVFAWNLPEARAARVFMLAAMTAFSVWTLDDVSERFQRFAAETRGASALMDRVGLHETFYYAPDQGSSNDFAGPTNKPMREMEQYATVRHGGLPNSSFAGYGNNYVKYVNNQNPMPGLYGPPSWSTALTRFDWVMTRSSQALTDKHFKHVESNEGWELYGVCGSAKFPTCP